MDSSNIIPIKSEPAVKLCRDCKWCDRTANPEFSRCLAPEHPDNKDATERLRALALVDPDIKVEPNRPFCSIERRTPLTDRCGTQGRWWEAKAE